MAFTPGDIEQIKESGKWNIAKEYSEKKLLNYLLKVDEYQTIAEMGGGDLNEEVFSLMNNYPVDQIRLKALKWFLVSLEILASNTKLAVNPKAHKERLKVLGKKLKKIKASLPYTFKTRNNRVTKQSRTVINEEVFKVFLEELIDLKEELQDIINRNNLIYINVEEFNPGSIKERIKRRAIDKG